MALPAFAAVLPTLLSTLDKWTEWARIREAPTRIDALEERLAALESKSNASAQPLLTNQTRAPGRACPACGEYAMRRTNVSLDSTRSDVPNAKLETWSCTGCGDTDEVEVPARR